MMLISAENITEQEAIEHEVKCELVDHAAIAAAEANNSTTFERCPMIPIWAVTFKPAEDMVIPVFLCTVHFNALKMSLHEGIGADENVFGTFTKP